MNMHIRTRANAFAEREYPDVESELTHMRGIELTDSEIEFLNMKRMNLRKKYASNYTPDPRLGDYEA